MMILKCKMCGGNIEITGESHGVCDSCGCEVTLPKLDDDRRAEMYNRGNHFRSRGEFDKAYSAYEHIIAEDGQDARSTLVSGIMPVWNRICQRSEKRGI